MKKETELEKKLHNKETIYNVLKDKEQKSSLANNEKKKLKKINRYFKNFQKYLEKLQKYQHKIIKDYYKLRRLLQTNRSQECF